MTTDTELAARIHGAEGQGMAVVTGGGSGALATLLQVPGASRTLLDACIPYSQRALEQFLGGRPDRACDAPTARALAMAAFHHARSLSGTVTGLFGVSCTASLATDRPKRGAHRVYVGLQTAAASDLWSVVLTANARTRGEEEALCTRLLLNAVAEAKQVTPGDLPALLPGEVLTTDRCHAPAHWQDLLLDRTRATAHDAAVSPAPGEVPRLVFPGAFNPVHDGHLGMARVASDMTGLPTEFEVCIRNVDKPPLDYAAIRDRVAQLPAAADIWLTATPTFTDKARMFGGAHFIVGVDTLARIADPRYYGDGSADPAARDAAFSAIAAAGCSFLVFGRHDGERFVGIDDLTLPRGLRTLCTAVPEAAFRHDLSSTELRKGPTR